MVGPACSKPRIGYGRRDVQVYDGPVVVVAHAPDVAATAVKAARALNLTGPLDIDIRRDQGGRPVVLEVNARFGVHIRFASEVFDRAFDQSIKQIMARPSLALAACC